MSDLFNIGDEVIGNDPSKEWHNSIGVIAAFAGDPAMAVVLFSREQVQPLVPFTNLVATDGSHRG